MIYVYLCISVLVIDINAWELSVRCRQVYISNHSNNFRKFIVLPFVKISDISLKLVQSINEYSFRLIKRVGVNKISIVQIHILDRIHNLLSLLVFICLCLGLSGCLSLWCCSFLGFWLSAGFVAFLSFCHIFELYFNYFKIWLLWAFFSYS